MESCRLNNNDLVILLEVKTNNKPLHKRLETDFLRNSHLKRKGIYTRAIPKLKKYHTIRYSKTIKRNPIVSRKRYRHL